MKDRADVRMALVARQIELDGNALPMRVGMRRDAIAGNVAGKDRDRIEADLGEMFSEPRFEPQCQSLDERRLHGPRAQGMADHAPYPLLVRRQVPNVFGKQIDLDPRRRTVRPVASLAAAGHRPVIGRNGQRMQHRGIHVVGKDPVELEVVERPLSGLRRADPLRDVVDQGFVRAFALGDLRRFRHMLHVQESPPADRLLAACRNERIPARLASAGEPRLAHFECGVSSSSSASRVMNGSSVRLSRSGVTAMRFSAIAARSVPTPRFRRSRRANASQ